MAQCPVGRLNKKEIHDIISVSLDDKAIMQKLEMQLNMFLRSVTV